MKTYKFKINEDNYNTRILEYKGDVVRVEVNGIEYKVELETDNTTAIPKLVRSEKPKTNVPVSIPANSSPDKSVVKAPIPGLVHTVLVKVGDTISKGDPVIILEAMKMESEISSMTSGKVVNILVKEGDSVQEGAILLEIGD
jgi:glutaconyl-CoA/methylmalonyl-CoA decarboxylase subunit gamma